LGVHNWGEEDGQTSAGVNELLGELGKESQTFFKIAGNHDRKAYEKGGKRKRKLSSEMGGSK